MATSPLLPSEQAWGRFQDAAATAGTQAGAPEQGHILEAHARLVGTFQSGRTKSYEWRVAQLQALRRLCTENADAVIAAIKADLGRPRMEAFLAEVAPVVSEIDYILGQLRTWMAPEARSTPLLQKPGRSAIVREPKGVVLNIAPWNFPINLSLISMASIIAAGNCCVLKPSEVAANCERFLQETIPRYMDADAVAVVVGGVPETTALLKLRWDHIMYTGNGVVARVVLKAAAEHLTPCTLELGGKSPTVVLPGANLPVAARRILAGKFMNAGQICIAPDYALVHEEVVGQLEAEMKKTLTSWYGEDARQSDSFGRIIDGRHFKRVRSLIESSGEAVVLQKGSADEASKFIPPTLVKDPSDQSAIMQEEIFGPVLPFITCKTVDDIIAKINSKEKPLAMYIFGREADADAIIRRTSSGGVCVNDTVFHVTSPELPFGGVGGSGMGRYHGKWGFDEFSHMRSVMYRATWLDPAQRYPPYNDSNMKLLEKVMIGPLIPEGAKKAIMAGGAAAVAAAVALIARRSRL